MKKSLSKSEAEGVIESFRANLRCVGIKVEEKLWKRKHCQNCAKAEKKQRRKYKSELRKDNNSAIDKLIREMNETLEQYIG